jgi:TonB-linked SusC/RagA family outer membrane protein
MTANTTRLFFSLLLLFAFSPGLWAQQGTVKGRVSSGDSTLNNVTVQVKGANRGTQTDQNGQFSLEAAPDAILIFSRVGYASQEVSIGGKKYLDIQLVATAKEMSEVIVVGYGTQKKADVTGAVASVPKSRLSELPVTNVLQAVEGSVAGVSVTNTSAVPGATPTVLIRGQNSITANSGPLLVVDGIPLNKAGGSINDINPNDIASIEILKDASATAIYGTNGSNGVILITTKRGVTGKAVIRYNGYAGRDDLEHILQPRDAASYVQKYADYMQQTNQPQTNPVPNAAELANYNAGKTTDWMKETTQPGITQDHNLSISGGNKDVRYFISGEYMQQRGSIKGYQYHRASFRANLDITLTNFLTIGTSAFVSNNNYDGGRANLLFATAMSPYGQEYNPDGTYAIYPMYPELLYTNPLIGLYSSQANHNYNLNGNGYAEVKFGGVLKGLRYRLNVGYNYIPSALYTYAGRSDNNPLGTATTLNSETTGYTIDNLLLYSRDFGSHHLDFTGLYSAQQRFYFVDAYSATGFVNDLLLYNNIGAGATVSAASTGNGLPNGSFSNKYNLNSQMVRINYSFADRYLVTLTARRDGSSVFGANTSKYGVFPVAAVGWNMTNEDFMKSLTFINNLKIRASYGKSGNEAINPYSTITTDNAVRYPFNGISTIGVLAGNLGNADLHWESTIGTNVGVDFAILRSRITGTIDVYSNHTSGLILRRNIPSITGYANVLDNLGKTTNKGVEVTLNTQNVVTKDFEWDMSVNFSANQNRIVDLYGDRKSDTGNTWFIGHPIGVIYDYKMDGVWQTGEDASKQDPGAKPGDLKFRDVNKDGKITSNDKVILGQTTPKWIGGITNTFRYKDFRLSFFIQTVQGITKNNTDLNYVDESGRRNTPAEVGYWTTANKSQTRPALSFFNTRGYGYGSDASFTRLKDITLSYTVSPRLLDKLQLGSLTIYASGRNLYTWTKWIGWDPENNYSGRGTGDWTNNYPTIRSVVLGLNITLR